MLNFKISETEDYEKLVPFFIENELEFSEDEPVPTDLVKCLSLIHISVDRETVVAAVLILYFFGHSMYIKR